jgi:hypothetical protein
MIDIIDAIQWRKSADAEVPGRSRTRKA